MSRVRRTRAFGLLALLAGGLIACSRRPKPNGGDSAAAGNVTPAGGGSDTGAVAAAPDTTPATADTARPTRTTRTTPPPPSPLPAPVPQPPSTARPTPSETVMTGKVVTGGLAADPVTTLQVEGGGPTKLIGPLEKELRRLNGATVWVAGAPASGPPNASFTVSRYDVVSIDGAKPVVGILTVRDGGTWLTGADTVRLASVPSALEGKRGAKVWIVGRRSGSELVVQTYGIIRDP